MRTKRDPEFAKNANQGSSRGVRLLHRPGRPKPFGVQWAERVWDDVTSSEVRKVKTEFFANVTDRDKRATQLRDAKRAGLLRTMSRREVDEWLAFRAAIGSTPWQNVVAGWRAREIDLGSTASPRTVTQHAKDFLARSEQRRDEGALSANWYRHQKHKLRLFGEHFGHFALNAVETADVEKWLAGLKLATPGTYNNYRKIVAAFFADAVHQRLLSRNPIDRVAEKSDDGDEVGILTVAQIAHLLNTAATWRDERGQLRFACCLRRLALEAFAGVRFSSACRLTAEDVNVEDRGIRHPSKSIKTRKRQYIEGYPDTLWEWLKIAPADELLTERFYLRLKSQLFEAAGVPHPHNCLRHSFATYHLAARTNPGVTAYLLCHRNQAKLWDHYKGNATAAEGRLWETITPQTAAELARPWVEELALRGDRQTSIAPEPSPDPRGTLPVRADE